MNIIENVLKCAHAQFYNYKFISEQEFYQHCNIFSKFNMEIYSHKYIIVHKDHNEYIYIYYLHKNSIFNTVYYCFSYQDKFNSELALINTYIIQDNRVLWYQYNYNKYNSFIYLIDKNTIIKEILDCNLIDDNIKNKMEAYALINIIGNIND